MIISDVQKGVYTTYLVPVGSPDNTKEITRTKQNAPKPNCVRFWFKSGFNQCIKESNEQIDF